MTTRYKMTDDFGGLVDTFAANALAVDAGGSDINANIAELGRRGLIRAMRSQALGGEDAGIGVMCAIASAIAQGCGSTAWNFILLATNNRMLTLFPSELIDKLFSITSDPIFAVAFSKLSGDGVLRRHGDQFVLSGCWRSVSGILQADWVMVAAQDEQQRDVWLVVPTKEVVPIAGSWDMVGMRGTKSLAIELSALAIRPWQVIDVKGAKSALLNSVGPDSPKSLPQDAITSVALASVAIGLAQRALSLYAKRVASLPTETRLLGSAQRLAKADIEVGSCRSVMDQLIELIESPAAYNQQRAMSTQRMKACCTFIAHRSFEVVNSLVGDVGTSGFTMASHFQLCWRDLATLSTHFFFNQNISYGSYGNVLAS